MTPLRILHLSDNHFSSSHLQKCIDSARQIEAIARTEQPELIIFSGDIQDRLLSVEEGSAYEEMLRHVQTMANIAPVIIIYGNEGHDATGSLEPLKMIKSEYPIHVSDYPETIYFNRYDDPKEEGQHYNRFEDFPYEPAGHLQVDAVIHTLPYPTKEFLMRGAGEQNRIDDMNQLTVNHLGMMMLGFAAKNIPGTPSILVAHANISGARLSNGQVIKGQDIIIPISTLEMSCADYLAFGHIHIWQMIGTHGCYAGSTYNVNFGETEYKYINMVGIIPGDLPVIENIRLTATRPMTKRNCEFIGGQVITEENMECEDWIDAELRVRVTMKEDEKKIYRKQTIKDFYSGAYSYQIEEEVIYAERTRSEEIKTAETLIDQFKAWTNAVDKTEQVTPEVIAELAEIETEFHKQNG